MEFRYAEGIGALAEEQRLHFSEVLAHQLTVARQTDYAVRRRLGTGF